MNPEAELLLFAASRAQLVRQIIEPALAGGKAVIADRFLDSTTVYQGVARKLDPAQVRSINEFAVGTCRPDLTIVMDMDLAVARSRMLRRLRPVGATDRMESQPPEFYEAVRAGYLRIAEAEPERIKTIDASQSVSKVQEAIWLCLEEKFHGILSGSGI